MATAEIGWWVREVERAPEDPEACTRLLDVVERLDGDAAAGAAIVREAREALIGKLTGCRAAVALGLRLLGLRPVGDGESDWRGDGTRVVGLPQVVERLADRARMELVPAGKYRIGDARAIGDKNPERVVEVPAYYIDVEWVRNRPFLQQVKGDPGRDCLCRWKAATVVHALRPMVEVCWRHARGHALALGMELPTEDQWEVALRLGASGGNPGPETRRRPSIEGMEWCADDFEPGKALFGASPRASSRKVRRGWFWTTDLPDWSRALATRLSADEGHADKRTGFRLVCGVPGGAFS